MGGDSVASDIRTARDDCQHQGDRAARGFRRRLGGASEVIRREVELARDKKPVVVSMSDVAASGGYWIAAPAE